MANKGGGTFYRVTEVIDLRIAEIEKLDVKMEDGKVVHDRARLGLSFKYDA